MWLLCSAVLAGCSVSEGGTPPELAARVNAEAITVQELAAAGNLERLIDQRLARQRALDKGLDRSPPVAQALESARTEILARAYQQFLAEKQPRPTPEEIRRYYAEHPELFARRRIYTLEEQTVSTLAAEQVPLELLARLQTMKEGDVHKLDDAADGVVVVRVAAARLAPLDEASAAPLIEKFLLARRAAEALAAERKRLRQEARIEYGAGMK